MGLNGAETNCGTARILGILLMYGIWLINRSRKSDRGLSSLNW